VGRVVHRLVEVSRPVVFRRVDVLTLVDFVHLKTKVSHGPIKIPKYGF
jgi:hypothetical protein